MTNFPNDADGDVLNSLSSEGVDLSKPRKIDFYCYAPDHETALEIIEELSKLCFESDIYKNTEAANESKRLSVYSAKVMVPSYEAIIEEQRVLNRLLKKYKTVCDGWGTLSDGA